jgi:Xaa-Pro aminopeptidase
MTAHAQRRERLRALLAESELDALLVTTLVNVRYLTGFTGSAAEVLVTKDPNRDVFVTDGRYDAQSAAQVPDLRRAVVPPATWLADAIGSARRLGLEAHTVSWQRAQAVAGQVTADVVPAGRLVEQLRLVKDEAEVASLRGACAAGDVAFAQMADWLRPGMTEREAALRLNSDMIAAGAQWRAFDMIFASGPNSAVPHHRPTDRALEAGDLIKVDFGGIVDGYHSDMTRMLSLGRPSAQMAEVFEVVRRSQRAGLEAAVAGAGTADVDRACRTVIDEAGYEGTFIHGTGHGVGLEIHEDPFLRPDTPRPEVSASASVTLAPGMTVTVEPGVYLPGVGGVRIEDSLVITPNGPDVLTRTPKDLVVL